MLVDVPAAARLVLEASGLLSEALDGVGHPVDDMPRECADLRSLPDDLVAGVDEQDGLVPRR